MSGRPEQIDVAIVGGGVIGCALAAELSKFDLSVEVLERRHDVGDETSKSNTGITTPGWGSHVANLELELCRRASPQWEGLCERLGVPYHRCGMVALATSDADLNQIRSLLTKTRANGIEAHDLGRDALRERAPHATDEARGAIFVPAMGVVDSPRLTVAYAELAALNGVVFRFEEPLVGAEYAHDRVEAIRTTRRTLRPRFVVNAAGLRADQVSRALGCEEFRITPRRGEWLLADREVGVQTPCILAEIPNDRSAGAMVTPSTQSAVLLGPSADDQEDKADRSTHQQTLDAIFDRCGTLMPSLTRERVIKHFAGLRPHSERLYRLERSEFASNAIQACAVRSTGISASPAIAEYLRDRLAEAGLELNPSSSATDRLPYRPRLSDDFDCEALAAAGPFGRTVICACEKVTALELHDAFRSPIPARSIAGAAKRTRATWGRCQGAACLSGVSFIASLYLQGQAWQLPIGERNATLGVCEARRG